MDVGSLKTTNISAMAATAALKFDCRTAATNPTVTNSIETP
jgi:hypothetical protein